MKISLKVVLVQLRVATAEKSNPGGFRY